MLCGDRVESWIGVRLGGDHPRVEGRQAVGFASFDPRRSICDFACGIMGSGRLIG